MLIALATPPPPPPRTPPHHHYVMALTLAVLLLYAAIGLFKHKAPVQRLVRLGGDLGAAIVPRILSLFTFLAGAILLFSGATPAVGNRLFWLYKFLPIPFVELSHFFDNLAGAGLLILARGVERRLDAAYHITLGVLAAAAVFSLTRALDYEQSLLLLMMLVAFLPARKYFTRKTSLIEERFSLQWTIAIALIIVASIALGFISYRRLALTTKVLLGSPASQEARFLRSMAGVMGVLIVFAIFRLVRPARPSIPAPSAADLNLAGKILELSPVAESQLALLGDKYLLFDKCGTGFIMYGFAGHSLVALGDPVGPARQIAPLIEQFVERANELGVLPVFYKAGPTLLHLYLDYDLAVVKLGEEARVRLDTFGMEGPERRNLRRVWRKIVDAGCSFELRRAGEVTDIMPQLRAISESWLEMKHTREKGFSLGFFEDAYLRRHPVGLVRQNGKIIAFCNVWQSGIGEEVQIDLMRYHPDAPPGLMRYLIVEMMQWARQEQYRWFNLGMAPLSGLRSTAGAPIWHQLGNAIRGYGERFYNFQGVREFKEWFHPEWEPRFLVSPGGAARPIVLANIAALISGGMEGLIRK